MPSSTQIVIVCSDTFVVRDGKITHQAFAAHIGS